MKIMRMSLFCFLAVLVGCSNMMSDQDILTTRSDSDSSTATNMIANGDFSDGINGSNEIWSCYKGSSYNIALEVLNTDTSFSGNYLHFCFSNYLVSDSKDSIQITKQVNDGSSYPLQSYSLTSGKTYTFSMKAKADQTGTIELCLQSTSSSATSISVTKDFDIDTTVQTFTYSYKATGGATINFFFNLGGSIDNVAGTSFYVDDVSLISN